MGRREKAKGKNIELPPVGQCIYCDSKSPPLISEHILPFGLGGNLILPRASCEPCAKITSKFERACLRGMFYPSRVHFDVQTRRPNERRPPSGFRRNQDGKFVEEPEVRNRHPLRAIGLILPPPGIETGLPPPTEIDVWMHANARLPTGVARPDPKLSFEVHCNLNAFCRMLAKIAHGLFVAEVGMEKTRPFLREIILGKDEGFFRYIGGSADGRIKFPVSQQLHKLGMYWDDAGPPTKVMVEIQLFANCGAPVYYVIVGECDSAAIDESFDGKPVDIP